MKTMSKDPRPKTLSQALAEARAANGGGGDVRSSELDIDPELVGQSFGLGLGRDDTEAGLPDVFAI